jgi:hypothetical protein
MVGMELKVIGERQKTMRQKTEDQSFARIGVEGGGGVGWHVELGWVMGWHFFLLSSVFCLKVFCLHPSGDSMPSLRSESARFLSKKWSL